jgi:pimeloyl-ACP methyl ester carboxylesterase
MRLINAFRLPAILLLVLSINGCGLFAGRIPDGHIQCSGGYDHFIKVSGVRYHYTDYPASGRDILFIHGFASSAYTWESIAPLLQKNGYHVWALDIKGSGWSDKPSPDDNAKYDLITLTDEIISWMDAVGLKKPVVAGNSLGGAMCLLMAIRYPESMDGLILIDSAAYPNPRMDRLRTAASTPGAFILKTFFSRSVMKGLLKSGFYNDDLITDGQIEEYYLRLSTMGAIDAQVAIIRSLDQADSLIMPYISRIPDITLRTLLIWGDSDEWVPADPIATDYNARIKGSKLVIIDKCGHYPQEEAPEATSKAVTDFVLSMN